MAVYQDPDAKASTNATTLLRVGFLVKRVQAALRAAMDESFRPLGLSVSQYAILEALVDIPESEATNAAIARRCFITPQSANEMIAAMTESGLISRRSGTGTRRIKLSLTKRGRDARIAARKLSFAVEERMLSGQTIKERERLAELLARCAYALENRS